MSTLPMSKVNKKELKEGRGVCAASGPMKNYTMKNSMGGY